MKWVSKLPCFCSGGFEGNIVANKVYSEGWRINMAWTPII